MNLLSEPKLLAKRESVARRGREEKFLIWTLVLFLCQDPVSKTSNFIARMAGFENGDILAIIVIFSPLILVTISRFIQGENTALVPFSIVTFSIGLGFWVSYLMHPEYGIVMFDAEWSYNIWSSVFNPLGGLFAVWVIGAFRSGGQLVKALTYFAYFNFVYNVAQFLTATMRGYWINLSRSGELIESSYSLGFGYDILSSVLIFFMLSFNGVRRPALHFSLGLVGLVMILLGGNRGAIVFGLLGFILFALFYLLKGKNKSPIMVFFLLGTTLISVLVIFNFQYFVGRISTFFQVRGIQSRTLDALVEGEFTDPNGRDTIGGIARQIMLNNNGQGLGFYGDRYGIKPFYWWGYPHNILLEFQLTFGLLAGSLILTVLIIYVLWAFIRSISDDSYRNLILLFGALSGQLVISGSYLYFPFFWGLLVVSFMALKSSRKSRELSLKEKSQSRKWLSGSRR